MINVLITGAGSVLGQSIFKALGMSRFHKDLRVYYTNSEPDGAGFFFNSRNFYDLRVEESILVPLARGSEYLPALRSICDSRKIDLIFGGTEHEIFRLSELKEEPSYAQRVMALPLSIVRLTTDKWLTARFFQRGCLPAPGTTLYADLAAWLPGRSYPFVIKPRISSASRNVFIINEAEEFEARRFAAADQIVVQECIGSLADEYTIGCYRDWVTREVHCITFQRRLSPDGASVFGVVVDNSNIDAYCRRIVDALVLEGLDGGPVNIQLRLHHGQPLCFEINGRYSSTEAPRAALGFNAVEAALVNRLEGRGYTSFRPAVGAGFVRYYEELFFDLSSGTPRPLLAPKLPRAA